MSSLAIREERISPMTEVEIEKVRQLETAILQVPQTKIATYHVLHAGMYSRTIVVPAGVALTGALMKIPTLLIINGDFLLFIGGKTKQLHGYNVFTGGANRKQAGVAITDTHVTMIFPTSAKTVEEAEEQFTDETNILFSRYEDAENHITITGE
jgi:hypothetical protein